MFRRDPIFQGTVVSPNTTTKEINASSDGDPNDGLRLDNGKVMSPALQAWHDIKHAVDQLKNPKEYSANIKAARGDKNKDENERGMERGNGVVSKHLTF